MALAPLNTGLMFLAAHGMRHHMTPEGILVQSEAVIGDHAMRHMPDDNDNWFEEPMVFPLVHGELVDMKPMRDWLGY